MGTHLKELSEGIPMNTNMTDSISLYVYCRKKKAKAEACKLTVIQKELDHLEQLVSVDVRILRNKIEESSREYLEAQYVNF